MLAIIQAPAVRKLLSALTHKMTSIANTIIKGWETPDTS